MKRFSGFIVLVFFAVVYFGCKPAPVFPDEPIIKFKEFKQHSGSDSLQVVFSFTDGDGDIGVAPNSTDSNMVLTCFHKNAAGQWVVLPTGGSNPNDSLMYTYRIPKLASGQNGLEGDIYVTVNKTFLILSGNDTLQFSAFLLDQSHHKSEVVQTPEVDLIP